jgi:restriction endonuclease S subunit
MNGFAISPMLNKNKVFLLQKSELGKRFDPFYYVPTFVELERKVLAKHPKKLRDYVGSLSSGATPKTTESDKYYTQKESGIPFLRVQNLSPTGVLEFEDCKYINKETHDGYLKRSQVFENDLLIKITGVGRMAVTSVAPANFEGNINQHIVVIRTKDKQTSEMLAAFLNSDIGEKLATRRSTGGTRPALDYPALLSIPILNDKRILEITKKAVEQKKQNEAQAEKLLASIDDYLLKELGITLPTPTDNVLTNRIFKTSITAITGNRFDPYYHQAYFQEVFNAMTIGKYEYSQIRKYASFQAGYAFKSTDYLDGSDCFLITIKNIRENQIDISDTTFLPSDFFYSYKDFQIKENDLLIAMTGATIGKVGIYNHSQKSLLNQRNGIIKPDRINSLYLMSLLNLSIFQKLILRNSNGGAQPNISETDIMIISIPVPPIDRQKEIAEHITAIRKQAKQLKDKAKEELKNASEEIERILLT